MNPSKQVAVSGTAKQISNAATFESGSDIDPAGTSVPSIVATQAKTLQSQTRTARGRQFGNLSAVGRGQAEPGIAAGAFKSTAVTETSTSMQPPALIADWSAGRISDATIKTHFAAGAAALSNAWPRDWPRTEQNDPPGFLLLASALQVEKVALFQAAASTTPEKVVGKLEVAMDCANTLHAKARHNENVVSVSRIMLGDEHIRIALDNDPGNNASMGAYSKQFDQTVLEAAKWHGLSDRDIPVAVLAAKRAPSAEDKATHIAPRSANSARIYIEANLPDATAASLIRQTRVSGDASRQRPLAAQFLDMTDRISAMGTKPFFKTDGKADAGKIFNAIDREMEKEDVHVAPDLKAAIKTCVEKGLLDAGLLASRKEDIYVRA